MSCSKSYFLGIVSLQFAVVSILLYDKYCKDEIKTTLPAPVNSFQELPSDFSTSVFCTGNNKNERECRFKNLCFDPIIGEYLYLHGNQSQQYGLPKVSTKSPLLDMSSVDDHNAKYFKYTDVLTSSYKKQNMKYIYGSSILFHRFNPQNLMHVLHDDLLPHFHTQRKYFPGADITTVMMDDRDEGPYFDLYELFMKKIVRRNTITELTCFEDVVVGLCKRTTWYQYGFKEPQGPINIDSYPRDELYHFRKDFMNRLGVQFTDQTVSRTIVYCSRQVTRKIVNEMELVFKLSTRFNMEVVTIDFQIDSVKDIVKAVSKASYLIGVHGAHLVTSLFLPLAGTLVEIFPFAVPSGNYTPYKTLACLRNIRYIVWENKNENNSIAHPDRSPNMGGINHLPVDMQAKIIETKTVPPHLCCLDPFWLYRIYQDTRVDVSSLLANIESDLNFDHKRATFNLYPYFYPGLVTNITCAYYDGELLVTWEPPWNLLWTSPIDITYEVLLQSISAEKKFTNQIHKVTRSNIIQLPLLEGETYFGVFINCVFDNKSSGFSEKQQCSR